MSLGERLSELKAEGVDHIANDRMEKAAECSLMMSVIVWQELDTILEALSVKEGLEAIRDSKPGVWVRDGEWVVGIMVHHYDSEDCHTSSYTREFRNKDISAAVSAAVEAVKKGK